MHYDFFRDLHRSLAGAACPRRSQPSSCSTGRRCCPSPRSTSASTPVPCAWRAPSRPLRPSRHSSARSRSGWGRSSSTGTPVTAASSRIRASSPSSSPSSGICRHAGPPCAHHRLRQLVSVFRGLPPTQPASRALQSPHLRLLAHPQHHGGARQRLPGALLPKPPAHDPTSPISVM